MTTGRTIALTRWNFVGQVMSLLFNMLSRLVITFLPRSKGLLISWLQTPSAVILEPKKIKSATVSTVSPSICHEVMGPDAMILIFWRLSFKPTFSLSSFTFIKSHYTLHQIKLGSDSCKSPYWDFLKQFYIKFLMTFPIYSYTFIIFAFRILELFQSQNILRGFCNSFVLFCFYIGKNNMKNKTFFSPTS